MSDFEVSDPSDVVVLAEPPPPGGDPTPIPGGGGGPGGGEGGGGGPPDPADGATAEVGVYIDGVDVTGCVRSGSVTRRLNRPWQASVQLYSECAPGGACSKLKIYVGGTLWFHGFVTQISTEAGEDGALISEYTAMDTMFLWQWRPARDPDGDFSNPGFFMTYIYGPQILQVILNASEDTTAGFGGPPPQYAEGTTFIDLATATYALGELPMSGAPTDWPMTIAECFELMSSTGTLDAILTPTEPDGNGNIASLAVYNGDYGTDRTATVFFDYATGSHNVRSVRMTEDSTNVCNKLWYYLGPRRKRATDPKGDQHWAANITGDDPALYGNKDNPFGELFPDGPVATHGPGGALPTRENYDFPATLGQRIADSRDSCGVRMEVRIYDAQGDENPLAYRWMYRKQWQQESWLRSVPRVLVHATPVRQSDNMLLPPGVTPVAVGTFDIGDLVTVTAGPIVRGGFSGAQRIYEYTVSWNEDGIVEVGELLTSSDQEGSAGP